jgi:phenylpropionate dioxygenase-like ring-hydroxylating dioxygenase large terminal subunit
MPLSRLALRGDGGCSRFPRWSKARIEPSKIRVRAYPVREQDGLIWIYYRRERARRTEKRTAARADPEREAALGESQTFPCGIDHAVIGLMDPAHAPYVHGRWWWRVSPREKVKALRAARPRVS